MKLNCRLGDMAYVVGSLPWLKPHKGKIIKVTCIGPDFGEGPTWDTEPILMYEDCELFVEDCCLRPIRPDESPEESTEAMRLVTQLPKKEKV